MNIYPELPETPDADMVRRYRADGYLAFRKALTADEVREASEGINHLVRKYAFNDELTERQGAKYGEYIKNGRGVTFKSRTSDFHFQTEGGYEPSPDRLDELADNIRKFQSYTTELPIYDYLANQHPRLLALLRAVLGEGCRLYSSMALCKPAGIGAEKPWHQDLAYFSVNRFDGVCGIWIALDEATVDNGCMHVIPGAHRGGPRHHVWTKVDCEITTEQVDDTQALPIPLPPGGLMIFDGLLPHETPANRSSLRRRALQFHYQSAATAIAPREEHRARFLGPDGMYAGCDYTVLKDTEKAG